MLYRWIFFTVACLWTAPLAFGTVPQGERSYGGFIISCKGGSQGSPTTVRVQMEYQGPNDEEPRPIDTGNLTLPVGTSPNAAAALIAQELTGPPNNINAADIIVVESSVGINPGVSSGTVESDQGGVKVYGAYSPGPSSLTGPGKGFVTLNKDVALDASHPTQAGEISITVSGYDSDLTLASDSVLLAIASGWSQSQLEQQVAAQLSAAGWYAAWESAGHLRIFSGTSVTDVRGIAILSSLDMGFAMLGGVE